MQTLLLAAFLLLTCTQVGVMGECDPPSQGHPAVQASLECSKEFGTDRLCMADCIGQGLGVMNKEGYFQPEKVTAMVDSLPDGELKEAMWELWRKCAKEGKAPRVNRELPNCMGYAKMAKCFRKVMTERCPGLMKMMLNK